MSADVTRVATLCNGAIGVGSTVGIDRVGAVVLLVGLAVSARKIGANLSANACAVANLEVLDLGAYFDNFADDLVSYAERERDFASPTAGNGVNVRGTDTTRIDGNVDVMVFKLLERELQKL